LGTVYKMWSDGGIYALHSFGDPTSNPGDPVSPPTGGAHLLSLALNPTTVLGGQVSVGTVTLDSPAPASGAVIALSSDSPAAVVYSRVVVLAGQTSATFNVTSTPVVATTIAHITATFNGGSLTASLTVNPPSLISLTLNPIKVINGANSSGVVSLNGPA